MEPESSWTLYHVLNLPSHNENAWWSVLFMFVNSDWFIVQFKSSIPLLLFCLRCPVIENRMLNFYIIIVALSISPILSIFALHILKLCCLVHSHLGLLCLLVALTLLSLNNVPLLSLVTVFVLKTSLSDINIATPTFFILMLIYLFPSFYIHRIYIIILKGSFL